MKSTSMKPIPLQFIIACLMFCYSCEQKPNSMHRDEIQIASKSDTTGSSKRNNETDSKVEDNTGNGIQITISPDVFKASSIGEAKLTISNNTQDVATFGDDYSIEYFTGQNWVETSILNDIVFTDMGYRIKPGTSYEHIIYLQPTPYDYKTGKYRINKEITLGKNPKTDESINVYAEFVVE